MKRRPAIACRGTKPVPPVTADIIFLIAAPLVVAIMAAIIWRELRR